MPSNTAKEKKSAPQAGTPTPKRRRRKSWDESTQESKQKIISAAFFCFGKIGYQKTTLTDIANVAGCSRELPRYHFKSKEGLVTALLDKILTDWKTIFEMPRQQGVTGTAAIHLLLDIYLGMSKNDPTVYNGRLALIFQLADPGMEPVKNQVIAMQRALRNGFRDFIKQSVMQGDSPRNTDIDAMAAIIFATFRGLAYQLMTDPEATDMQRIGKQLKVVINKIMA